MAYIKVFISSVQREFANEHIEHLGTGTTDMISDCEAFGLRTPEFQQAEDFRTIIYRAEKVSDPTQKVSDLGEKVTEQPQKVTKQVEKVTEQTEKVIEQAGKSNQADPKSNQVDPKSNQAELKSNQVRLTAKQRKVLEFATRHRTLHKRFWACLVCKTKVKPANNIQLS